MSIDFAAVKSRVDLRSIVERYTTLTRKGSGPCPVPGCTADEDGFYIHSDKQNWACRKCGVKSDDVIGLIRRIHGVDVKQAVAMLTDGNPPTTTERRQPVRKEPIRKASLWADPDWQQAARSEREYAHASLTKPRPSEYLRGRGLDVELCREYGFGFTTHHSRQAIVIPWDFPNGDVTGIKYRFLDDRKPRFVQMEGSESLLFGLKQCTSAPSLVLTEGEFNCLAIRQVLDRAEFDVVSIGSQTNTKYAGTLAKAYRRHFVWLDEPDLSDTVRSILKNHGAKEVIGLHSLDGQDACDLLKTDPKSLLARFGPPTPAVPDRGEYVRSELYYKIDALYRQADRTHEAAKSEGDASLLITAKQVMGHIRAYDSALLNSWEEGDQWKAANASRLMEQIAILADPPLKGKQLQAAIFEEFPGANLQEAS